MLLDIGRWVVVKCFYVIQGVLGHINCQKKSYIFIRRGFLQPRTLLASLGGLINRFFLISLMTKFSFLFVTVEGGQITVCCILDPCFCIYNIYRTVEKGLFAISAISRNGFSLFNLSINLCSSAVISFVLGIILVLIHINLYRAAHNNVVCTHIYVVYRFLQTEICPVRRECKYANCKYFFALNLKTM